MTAVLFVFSLLVSPCLFGWQESEAGKSLRELSEATRRTDHLVAQGRFDGPEWRERDAIGTRIQARLGHIAGIGFAIQGLVLMQTVWLLAAWAGAGWSGRSSFVRTTLKASIVGFLLLPCALLVTFLTGRAERIAPDSGLTVVGLIFAAEFGAVVGGITGGAWSVVARNRTRLAEIHATQRGEPKI